MDGNMKIPHYNLHRHDHRIGENTPAADGVSNSGGVSTPKAHFSGESIITSAVNFAESRANNTGHRLMQELNLNDVKRHHKSAADRILNLSDNVPLFFAFDQRTYKPSDPYVKEADFRMAITKKLEEENPKQKVRWVESCGAAEPGDGFYFTVPVFSGHGAWVVAGFGFSAGVLLRYRTSKAVVGDIKQQMSLASPKPLPINAESARQLEAGQEFEICGQGKLRVDANIGVRYGLGFAPVALAGIGENIGGFSTVAAEYGINVISLDGVSKVRVTIRKIHQESLAEVSNLAAGLIIPPNKFLPGNYGWAQVQHGLLKFISDHKNGPPNFEALLQDFTTLALNCSLTQTHKHLHVCAYDIDLGNPRAAEAYNALMRLDAREAETLALTQDGVTKADLEETQLSNKAAVRLALCTEKLFLVEALKYESHGELFDGQGHHKIYRDRAYKKHVENWLTGHHDALWEVVEIKKDDEDPKTYYHFNYQKEDFFTRQSEIDTFFIFADALDIKRTEGSNAELIDMHSYQKLFSHADDTKLNVDLYFTSAGVERLRAMQQPQMVKAFLATRAKFDPWVGSMPLFSSDKSIQEAGSLFLYKYRMARRHKIHRLKLHEIGAEYFHQFGRDIKKDFGVIRKAERFAQLSQYLVAAETDEERLGKFFTALGKSRRPHYTQVIPTLAEIAGRDNVLIHTLAASGGDISLKSVDEGALTHPRQEMVKLCLTKGSA